VAQIYNRQSGLLVFLWSILPPTKTWDIKRVANLLPHPRCVELKNEDTTNFAALIAPGIETVAGAGTLPWAC